MPRPVISWGSEGRHVSDCQQMLTDQGYQLGSVDGIFGDRTGAAVVYYQSCRDLNIDGIVGPRTWAALESEPPADVDDEPAEDNWTSPTYIV